MKLTLTRRADLVLAAVIKLTQRVGILDARVYGLEISIRRLRGRVVKVEKAMLLPSRPRKGGGGR